MVDIGSDLSCFIQFLAGHHYWFAAIALAVFAGSILQQHALGCKGMYKEFRVSFQAGLLSDGFLAAARTEKSLEAPAALFLQTYAYPFVSMSSDFAVYSFGFSILLSVYSVMGATYDLLYVGSLKELEQLEQEEYSELRSFCTA